jgi:hypothetical protein
VISVQDKEHQRLPTRSQEGGKRRLLHGPQEELTLMAPWFTLQNYRTVSLCCFSCSVTAALASQYTWYIHQVNIHQVKERRKEGRKEERKETGRKETWWERSTEQHLMPTHGPICDHLLPWLWETQIPLATGSIMCCGYDISGFQRLNGN